MATAGSPLRRITKGMLVFLLLVALALGAGRLYLPYWAKGYVNRQIAALHGYGGSVDGLGISLWRGAYQIHGLHIFKTGGGLKEPFVDARLIDLSVQWRALLRGRVVAEADIDDIALNFALNQTGRGGGWPAFVDALSPFDFNHVNVHGGRVSYLDHSASPDVNVYIADIEGGITNLRNVEGRAAALPSDLRISGTSIGKGRADVRGHVNILRDIPDFDLDMKLENADLPALNDYARAAAGVDFARGKAGLYSELAAADGHLTGYVKFLATGVSLGSPRRDHNVIQAVWQGLVGAFMAIFKNQPKDQFALRVPVAGNLRNPDKDAWSAFFSIFSNAFGKAFTRDTDGRINFSDALRAEGK